jgi:type 1 glutamine amidotransferase
LWRDDAFRNSGDFWEISRMTPRHVLGLLLLIGLSSAATRLVASEPTAAPRPKRLLLLGQGPDGHAPRTHEFLAGLNLLKKCLDRVDGVESTVLNAGEPWPDGPERLDKTDGVVIFLAEGAKWIHQDQARLAALKRLAARQGGFTGLHWGIGARNEKHVADYLALLGGCHGGPDRKYKVVEVRTEIAAPKHPILSAVESVAIEDEFYYRLKFAKPPTEVIPLLRVPIDGESHPVAWAWERPGGGRSFGFSGLHFHRNWQHDPYRRLVAQGIVWTLNLPIPTAGLNVEIEPEDLRLPQ